MKNYGRKSTFASFLPGIAGIRGIPIWSFYVNRGQGIVSFGVDHKDHAIMEFYPAHVAYQNVKRTGFRTFIRKDGKFVEAFANEDNEHEMTVGMNSLEIKEELKELGLEIQVSYFTLPEENVGALVRMVKIINKTQENCNLEVIDGMPAVIPYGVGIDSMKNMTQTAKAWMQVEDADKKLPFYRVRASMDDAAEVSMIDGGNFALGLTKEGSRLEAVVDCDAIFDYDLSLEKPVTFKEGGLAAVRGKKQKNSNLLPSGFFLLEKSLKPGEGLEFVELFGQVERKSLLDEFVSNPLDCNYFEDKKQRAIALVEELVMNMDTCTGDRKFDDYCRYTYMDNLLRGGYPIKLGNNKTFYVYSRKHGDLERDYNYFAMAPEFYSQGNGNFRDVNQNRRLDTFFAPFVGRENIRLFYSLVQLDGYNPLGIEKLSYTVNEDDAKLVVDKLAAEKADELISFLAKPFTPGGLYRKLLDVTANEDEAEQLFVSLIDFAKKEINANFGEGYWSDHWDYNLDLVEEYLSVFPEQEEEMLYEEAYTFFLSAINVNPRAKRYALTKNGVRQYHALNEASKRNSSEKLVKKNFGAGEVLTTTLMGKLLLLCANKFATLDPFGMGIEMEAGKPGWYDALNGLPGMLGSSMAETFELARTLDYTISALEKYPRSVILLKELGSFLEELSLINDLEKDNLATKDEVISFWNRINDAKEIYREKTFSGVSGETTSFSSEKLVTILKGFRSTVSLGITKAVKFQKCPTYFSYEVTDYDKDVTGIYPKAFKLREIPLFLEGPVRYLKLDNEALGKKELYDFVKSGDLYDKKLSMYKVNASLEEASYELGRCRSFTPGWLENESIWLHMEYKYLLEILKSGMYEEFAEDFHKAVIPFLDEEVYGRSTLENSSFIASSKNPDEAIHGKGFVARLSGSTIEFMHMWKIMMFGRNPFKLCEKGDLCVSFEPMIPSYLIGEDKKVSAAFLGTTRVEYLLSDQESFVPGNYRTESISLKYKNRSAAQIKGERICGPQAVDIRNGQVETITVTLVKQV